MKTIILVPALNQYLRTEEESIASSAAARSRFWSIWINKLFHHFRLRWTWPVYLLLILYVGLPWLAPLLMEIGWNRAGSVIYLLYAFLCHQLPQRSFFLFGDQAMYSLAQIQNSWQDTNDPLILRQFIGDAGMGWKVAWSDRMVFMYTPIVLLVILYWLLRKRIRPMPWWGLLLFLLPMVADGLTHLVSDFTAGIGLGFRDSNSWLAALTNNSFPATFYLGDSLGSFNSWMRLLTGLLFSLGVVWTLYPRLNKAIE